LGQKKKLEKKKRRTTQKGTEPIAALLCSKRVAGARGGTGHAPERGKQSKGQRGRARWREEKETTKVRSSTVKGKVKEARKTKESMKERAKACRHSHKQPPDAQVKRK